MDRAAGAGPPPPRSRSDTDVRGSGQVVNPDLAMYDNLRQRPSRCDSSRAHQAKDRVISPPPDCRRARCGGRGDRRVSCTECDQPLSFRAQLLAGVLRETQLTAVGWTELASGRAIQPGTA